MHVVRECIFSNENTPAACTLIASVWQMEHLVVNGVHAAA